MSVSTDRLAALAEASFKYQSSHLANMITTSTFGVLEGAFRLGQKPVYIIKDNRVAPAEFIMHSTICDNVVDDDGTLCGLELASLACRHNLQDYEYYCPMCDDLLKITYMCREGCMYCILDGSSPLYQDGDKFGICERLDKLVIEEVEVGRKRFTDVIPGIPMMGYYNYARDREESRL